MDPTTAQIIKKMDDIATPAIQGFLPTLIDKMTGFKLSQWSAQGKQAYEKEMIEWEKEKNLIMAFSQAEITRKVNNFLTVAEKASTYVDPSKEFSIRDDNDVFWGLLEHSKTVSNEEVQEIIAKIIAGEYNTPGTYSMSTLQILKSLGKKDLEKLTFFASFYLNGHGFLRDFFNIKEKTTALRSSLGINYADFLELQNLGLIQSGGYVISVSLKKDSLFKIEYCDESLIFKVTKDLERWSFPECYALTSAGREIVQHLKIAKNEQFKEYLREFFKEKGFESQN
jgi:hypothetical protein